MNDRLTRSLLNLGHALDHMFLLIFATAVTSIATEFGFQKWEDLMPYSVAAFFFFGVGSLPAGKLGDQWGRRSMMIIFFIGIGAAAIGVSLARAAEMSRGKRATSNKSNTPADMLTCTSSPM